MGATFKMTWWMNPDPWRSEVEDVKRNYPDAEWFDVEATKTRTRLWRLTFDPIPRQDELYQVLHDLDKGYAVNIGQSGNVDHSDLDCGLSLEYHPIAFNHVKLRPQTYKVEFTYPDSPHRAAGSVHPNARVLVPEISVRTYPKHPHMYVGLSGDSWGCPLSPQATGWRWEKGATVRYLDQVAIWLVKSAVWIATGGGVLSFGKWIGPDTPHTPLELLRMTNPAGPCWCGRGKVYQNCHIMDDINKAASSLHVA